MFTCIVGHLFVTCVKIGAMQELNKLIETMVEYFDQVDPKFCSKRPSFSVGVNKSIWIPVGFVPVDIAIGPDPHMEGYDFSAYMFHPCLAIIPENSWVGQTPHPCSQPPKANPNGLVSSCSYFCHRC